MRAAPRLRLSSAIAVAVIAFSCCLLSSASAGSTAGNTYEQLVKSDYPVAYWRLNEISGKTAYDASGNNLDLKWTDPDGLGRTPNTGILGIPALAPDKAVGFLSSESNVEPYGEVGYHARLNPLNFSVEAWVRPSYLPTSAGGLDSEAILCSRSTLATMGYMLYLSKYGDNAQFAFNAGNDKIAPYEHRNWIIDNSTGQLSTSAWYHVVATLEATNPVTMHLYVNGQDVGFVKNAEGFFPNTSGTKTTISIGDHLGGLAYGFDGALDEVAFYDHVLSSEDVLAHYQAGMGITPQPKPTLSLSPGSSSHFVGGQASFSVNVGNVLDATGASLTAEVRGKNTRDISPIVINGTTATFSYKGSKSGKDTVLVKGMINGRSVKSDPVNVYWLAGANALEGSFGDAIANLLANIPTCYWADPVNSVTGNFFETYTDVSLPGTGVPFSLDRTYNSRDDQPGNLGRGWSASVFTSLSVDEAGNVTVNEGGGQETGFVLKEDGSYAGDSNVTAKLTKTSSGYDLLLHDQNVQHFDSEGRLVSWLDPNERGLHFAYGGDGRLASVTDSGGREIDFAFDGDGRLTTVTLPDSSTVSYQFSGEFLTSVTDQTGAVTTYVYGSRGFLARATDPSGKVLFENTYDDEGRVLTQTDPAGNTISFDWSRGEASDPSGTWKDSYTDRNELAKRIDALGNETKYSYNEQSKPVSMTDPLGNETKMTYDARGNMLTQTDALGNTESWTFDEDNNVLSHTDQLGNVSYYTYDAYGNQISETDPLGAVTTNEYDSAGRLVSTTDPLGRTTRSVYDGEGNLIATISPSGARTTFAYDALGREISKTDPLGNTTSSEYDAAGRLIKTTDPLGHSTTSTYDAAGRVVAQTDANGNETHYEYDDAGRQVAVIAPDGATTRSSYDEFDYLVASTDALGNVTHYEYDALGRQTATISPSGARTTTSYDANGKQVGSTDPLGHTTTTAYDALGRQISSTDPLGRTTKTVYDAAGNVVKKIDPLGHETTSTYDAAGRVVKETDPLGHFTSSTYDAAGQQVAETDANGNTTHHVYDADGREISVTSPTGAVTTSAYDTAGNLINRTDANGHATTYAYNAAGNKISETNPLGARTTHIYDANGNEISSKDPLGHTTTTAYNSMNRQISTADPLGRTAKTAYDLNGNVVRTTDPLGNATTSDYDAEGRLTKKTDPLGHATTYAYDAAGQLVAKTDANGHTTHYAYDAAGEKVSVTAPGGAVTTYDYNANGNVLKRTDANGHATTYSYDATGNKISKTNALGSTWHYAYDPNGNLVQTKTPSGGTIDQTYNAENRLTRSSYSDSTPTVSYSYDPAGNKVSTTDGTGTTRYSYDAADQRVSASSTSGAFLYTYDEDGNLLSRSYPNGLKTSYSYNDADEMVMATVKGEKTRYTYDANGSLATTLHPSGILDTRSYDAAGRTVKIVGTSSHAKPFYSRSYSYDAVGNPTSLTATDVKDHSSFSSWWKKAWKKHEALTKWTETYSYDSRDRLTKACMNATGSRYFEYAYDPVGNRTSLQTRKRTTLYSYDAADELVSKSVSKSNNHHHHGHGHHHHHDKLTLYAYDLNGNEVSEGSTHYSYNLENKLTEVKDEHGHDKVSYTYGGEGLMATRSTRSKTTSYSWDTSSDLGQLALETDSRGWGRFQVKDTRSYTYGVGALGIATQRESYTFHTDSLGSVIELTNSRGKLVESYRYSPYGEDYAPGYSGEAENYELNPIRYTGQHLDSEADLYNMRAREYESETGRFLQVDPIEAGVGENYLGVYIYADDQPTVKTDPSGMCVPSKDSTMSPCMRNHRASSNNGLANAWYQVPSPRGFDGQNKNFSSSMAFYGSFVASTELMVDALINRVSWNIASKRLNVINRALSAYGTWYVWDAGAWYGQTKNLYPGGPGDKYQSWSSTHKGFDCSGFVAFAYGGVDKEFAIDASNPLHGGTPVEFKHTDHISRSQLIPADILFYNGLEHVAIYIGNGLTIQAPHTYAYVSLVPMGNPTSYRRYKKF